METTLSKDSATTDARRERGPVSDALHRAVLEPLGELARSPALRRTLAGSLLLAAIVTVSVGVSIIAYLVFYYSYIPRASSTYELALQYGYGRAPFAEVDVSRAALATDQGYDVFVDLLVPATQRNMDAGNFMVELEVLTADSASIYKSSKPTSLEWTPGLVEAARLIFRLPLYILGLARPSTQKIRVELASQQVFKTFFSGNPAQAIVSIGRHDVHNAEVCGPLIGATEIQVYKATLAFRAHLRGLRWFMYSHRILAFGIFTGIFLAVTISASLLAWGLASFLRSNGASGESDAVAGTDKLVKSEDRDYEDENIFESHDKAEARETRQRERAWQERTGGMPRMYNEGARSVLGHLATDSEGGEESVEENKSAFVKKEDEEEEEQASASGDDSSSSPSWHNVQARAGQVKVEGGDDDFDDTLTVGGSTTTAGDASSRHSFGPSVTTATSTSSRDPSLRRRASHKTLGKSPK